MDQTTLKELKRDLYRALLLKPTEMLSAEEIEIAYCLALDEDIQSILRAAAPNKPLDADRVKVGSGSDSPE